MTARFRKILRRLALLAACLTLAGCLGKSSPQVTYYSLLSLAQLDTAGAQIQTQTRSPLAIGIGPISLPDPLKRNQLVTRDARNIYHFDEFHRWAGTLEEDIALVLGNNLGELLGGAKIAFFPWRPHFVPTHRLIIDILRFDGQLAGEAVLNLHWTIADATGKVQLASGKSVYRQGVAGADYAALVAAQSQLLAALSRELAAKF